MEITILKNIYGANDQKADELRSLLKKNKVFMANIIGSPGCGKTALLEKILHDLGKKFRIAVIEGDIATDRDARRLQRFDTPIALINTDGACHLEALSIEKAIQSFNLKELDIILIENVGNLVCPAEFDIGEHAKIAMVSTTEGDDKPAKYPLLFREASSVILSKMDLLEHTDFNKKAFHIDLQRLNGELPVFEISSTKPQGLGRFYQWLETKYFELYKKNGTWK
ncbi:MAG: hydrogenase nickel incorporation protein HypB [Marinifilaceae bacterium]